MSAFGGKADMPNREGANVKKPLSDSKANLKKGFLVLDISDTPFRVRKAPVCPAHPGVKIVRLDRGMTHAWNERYRALYDRTHRVLCDAGVDEIFAGELASRRALAAALRWQEQLARAVLPHRFHAGSA